MTWTTELPTKPGWWWWRPTETTERGLFTRISVGIYKVKILFEGGCFVLFDGDLTRVELLAGEWSSEPVPEPKEKL